MLLLRLVSEIGGQFAVKLNTVDTFHLRYVPDAFTDCVK
jgi:hypothetical protein